MSLPLTFPTAPPKTSSLERAILEALAYSDIFDQPLRLEEVHRYLPIRVELDDLLPVLNTMNGWISSKDGLYFLTGREEIVEIRTEREARSRELLPHAIRYGRILGRLPFIRMVALTGSLAVLNVSKNADFDYMLIAAPGRVWTARAFALLFNRFTQILGHTLCPNLIITETVLEWGQQDLYSARELHQMIPITGMDVYRKLMQANEWTRNYLPNAGMSLRVFEKQSPYRWFTMAEWFLRGKLGDRLESWEMNRKIARFSMQKGFGDETVFTAEICQGNFHHHRKWTKMRYEEKLDVIARPAHAGRRSSPMRRLLRCEAAMTEASHDQDPPRAILLPALRPKLWEAMRPYPPLGTLYAASWLRQHGYEVALFDAMLAESEEEWAGALDRHKPRYTVIYEDNFNYLSKMCLLRMREAAFRMIHMAKTRGCTVILCGADVTDHYADYLEKGADYCILGEGRGDSARTAGPA
jgi:hypothetical protein